MSKLQQRARIVNGLNQLAHAAARPRPWADFRDTGLIDHDQRDPLLQLCISEERPAKSANPLFQ